MELPDYWIPQPPVTLSDKEVATFKQVWSERARCASSIPTIRLPQAAEPWRFLHWLVQSEGVLLHGSAKGDIELFLPRAPHDYSADDFSKQTAVYGTSDPIWSIYYAVLNRSHGQRHLNACLQFWADGIWSNPHYFFSLGRSSRARTPWQNGFVYLSSRNGFVQQPPYSVQGWTVLDPHFASTHEVKPLARIAVEPRDFPLLSSVREHDVAAIAEAQARDPLGFPWLDYGLDV